jgi:Haem-binding domain/Cytochrome P460
MTTFGKLIVAGLFVLAVLQLVRPAIPAKPATAEIQAPPDIKQILDKDCYSCHSDERRLAWFDQIVPGYWLVRHDILSAREHLNFSTLGSKPVAAQKAALFESVNMIQLGTMPLPSFLKLHPDANVTPQELSTLKTYLAPWTPALTPTGNGSNPVSAPPSASPPTPSPVALESVGPEPNGFAFDPSFENWKPISTTDRGDNRTFRFILGNDIAVRAAQTGSISPWPDGTRFAKIAWPQELGSDGLVHPGNFVQVELMVKDARLYKNTEGWGWGRWRGLDLKPYGADARFVNECTSCHQPMHGNDYVYSLPITTVKLTRDEVVNNRAADLPASLPYQPLGWNAITMYVDPNSKTTATLYGNDDAMCGIPARGVTSFGGTAGPAHPAGAVLALVTWIQRDDPHWFGARIPDSPQTVEFVQVAASGGTSNYHRFAGRGLLEDSSDASTAAQRTAFILGLAPARLP